MKWATSVARKDTDIKRTLILFQLIGRNIYQRKIIQGSLSHLTTLAFVFKMMVTAPNWDMSYVNLQWPVVTAEKEMMYEWFKHIKDALDREAEPFILSRIDS